MDLKSITTKPGVYLFYDANNKLLYIGKAKNLRKRISSYFSKQNTGKTAELVNRICDIKTIVVRNEVEALLLEANLIREHKPPFNTLLKNSRRYAWIVITKEKHPRIISTRNKKIKGDYYGPYTSGTARQNIIVSLNKIFKLRTCNKLPKKVCLQYHIGNCTGPCEFEDKEYSHRVEIAKRVLKGETKQIIRELKEKMILASEKQNFELAKQLRDQIRGLEYLQKQQVIEKEKDHDQHVIGENNNNYCVIHVHNGVIAKQETYKVDADINKFIEIYYLEQTPPKEIILREIKQKKTYEEYLSRIAGGKITITTPKKGDKLQLLVLAEENAKEQKEHPGISEIQKILKMPKPPRIIDCFDISTNQGDETVAASVRYSDGKPDPTNYRKIIIPKEYASDDYKSIEYAVKRKYQKGTLPDLILIDGGKGQLSAAIRAAEHAKIKVPIISLAKKQEEVFVPGLRKPLFINQKNPGLLLLRRIRDATHRQAIGFHRKRKEKKITRSTLEHIPGLGPKRRQKLYDEFKNINNIVSASKKELQKILGEKLGEKLYEHLHSKTT